MITPVVLRCLYGVFQVIKKAEDKIERLEVSMNSYGMNFFAVT